MQWLNIILALPFVSAVLLTHAPAIAQDKQCTLQGWAELDMDYRTALEGMATSPCLHAENNTSALGLQVRSLLEADEPDPRSRALQVLDLIEMELVTSFAGDSAPQDANGRALLLAIQALKQGIIANPSSPEASLKLKWKLDSLERMPPALDGLDFSNTLMAPKCANIASNACTTEFNTAADVLRAIFLVNAALDEYTGQFRADAIAARKLRRTKWDSYYDDLTFQYPWELWANGYLLERTDDRAMIDGNRVGFRALPSNKLVLLHPEANPVYADKANKEYDLSLTVELLGYERFGFDGLGKVRHPWGISLLAAYLPKPRSAVSDWTAGLLFKYDGYSIGVTDNHGETGIVFNVNLAQRIFDIRKDARKYYDEYQNKSDAIRDRLQ
jgi:hypothetical protein